MMSQYSSVVGNGRQGGTVLANTLAYSNQGGQIIITHFPLPYFQIFLRPCIGSSAAHYDCALALAVLLQPMTKIVWILQLLCSVGNQFPLLHLICTVIQRVPQRLLSRILQLLWVSQAAVWDSPGQKFTNFCVLLLHAVVYKKLKKGWDRVRVGEEQIPVRYKKKGQCDPRIQKPKTYKLYMCTGVLVYDSLPESQCYINDKEEPSLKVIFFVLSVCRFCLPIKKIRIDEKIANMN